MKVLFITNIPSPYRLDFFNELGKLCDLTVAFEGEKATDRNEKWKGTGAETYNAIYMKGKRTGSDNFFCLGILKILKEKWDNIIVGMYSTPTAMLAIEYMKLLHIPFYIESDGGFIKNENRFLFAIKKHYISSATGWFSSGDATSEYLSYYGANIQKCYKYPFTSLLHNDFIEAEKKLMVKKTTIKEALGISEDFVVITVGRFSYDAGYGKGYDTILKAAEDMDKTIGFYFIGDEPTQEFVNWKEEKCLINVHFVGFMRKDELNDYYAAADVFVLMTKGDVWGLVVNEAMMYGLPIITTDKCIAGLELVKNGENGMIIPVGSNDKLKVCIEELWSDSAKRLLYSRNSQLIISEYTIEKMAQKHIEVLNYLDNLAER